MTAGVDSFIQEVTVQCENLGAEILAFTLQLAGWMASNEETYHQFESLLNGLFQQIWSNEAVLANTSVVTAFYDSLVNLTKHTSGLKWIIFDNKDFLFKSFSSLETRSSIFLEKAIIGFQSTLLIASQHLKDDGKGDVDEFVTCWLDRCSAFIHTCAHVDSECSRDTKRLPVVASMLKVLQKVCTCDSLCTTLMTRTQLVDDVISMVLLSNETDAELSVNVLKGLFVKSNSQIDEQMDNLMHKLYCNGDVKRAQRLAFMCLQSSNQTLNEKCITLLTRPLRQILSSRDESDTDAVSARDVLNSKMAARSHCTDMLCKSINSLANVKTVVGLVARVLSLSVSSEATVRGIPAAHLYNNRRIQRCCMQFLQHHTDTDKVAPFCPGIVESVIKLMRHPDIDSLTYTACVKCLHPHILCLFQPSELTVVSNELSETLKRHLCAVCWELRDTTLEFLGMLLDSYSDNVEMIAWLEMKKLHVAIWQCVSDGESYVRATAISSLLSVLRCCTLWESLLTQLDLSERKIIQQILSVLHTDTEAFARRSAATFIYRYFLIKTEVSSASEIICNDVIPGLIRVIHDFDWEVKLVVLNFFEHFLENELQHVSLIYTKQMMNSNIRDSHDADGKLGENANNTLDTTTKVNICLCLPVLLYALQDYDQKVCEKACHIINSLKAILIKTVGRNVTSKAGLEPLCDIVLPFDNCQEVTDSKPCKRIKLASMESVVNGKDDVSDMSPKFASVESVGDGSDVLDISSNKEDILSWLQQIINFDMSVYMSTFQSTSDYTQNPRSLIGDILSYMDKNGEENAVDCY